MHFRTTIYAQIILDDVCTKFEIYFSHDTCYLKASQSPCAAQVEELTVDADRREAACEQMARGLQDLEKLYLRAPSNYILLSACYGRLKTNKRHRVSC